MKTGSSLRAVAIAVALALGLCPAIAAAPVPPSAPLPVLGFYMGWDAASRASLAAHVGALAQVAPGVATVTGADHRFAYERDADLQRIFAAAPGRPALIPMVQNVGPAGWDGQGAAALLASPAARARLIAQIVAMVAAEQGAGVMLDMESLPPSAHPGYRALLGELRAAFAPRRWQVMIAAPVGDADWDLAAYARVVDRVVLMAYDEHWMGGPPGPIASQPWFAREVAAAVAATGPDRAIVALGNYAYDSAGGHTDPLTVAAARALARRMGAAVRFDRPSGNWHFTYRAGGRVHQVWLLDATTAANQLRVVRATGAAGIALWRLGSEDPRFWQVVSAR